ncbi:ABC transporter permease [Fulvivirga lutimaris]|uniref:ABC transporter permease n=1 Tax=Fulvivirga lutimaris TaxID=1819566 RepID=UPI0012BD0315|nr:ABC transporter permease [Fulvivirga lutimaris]
MLKFHLRVFLRRISKNVFFNAVNFIGITIALTVAIAIFSFVLYESSFDNFHNNADKVYRVVQDNVTANGVDHWSTTAYPLAGALRNDFSDLEVTQTAGPTKRLLTVNERDKPKNFEVDHVLFADTSFFKIFNYGLVDKSLWIQGEYSIFKKQHNAILLTESLANKLFGIDDSNIIGREIELNNNSILTVAGVISDPPLNSNIRYEAVINFSFFRENNPYPVNNWSGNYQGYTYIKLPENLNKNDFEQRLPAFESKYLSESDDQRINYQVQSLVDIHNDTTYSETIESYAISTTMLNSLIAVAILLIIISSANYINLASALIINRSKEVVLLKMFGDLKRQLVKRYMLETSFLIVIAAVHALVFGQYLIDFINNGILGIPFNIQITAHVYALVVLLCCAIVLITSLYPILIMSRFDLLKVLKNNGIYNNQAAGGLISRVMLLVQFSFVHIMVVGVAVVYFQMSFLKNKDLGFEHDEIVTVTLPKADSLKMERLRQSYGNYNDIEQVSFSSGVPFESDIQYGTAFRLSSEPVEMGREAEMKVVDLDYAALYDLELLAGSWISKSNILPWQQGFNGFVVNETLAAELGIAPEELIGQKIAINEGEAEVLGVVKDFHNMWLKDDIKPCLMFYWGTGFYSKVAMRINNAADREQAINFIEQQWKKEYPEYNFESEWFNDRIDNVYELDDLTLSGLKVSGFIAIIIGSSGLLALMVFYSESRTKELGIRKILGATAGQLAIELSSSFMKQVVLSIIIGTCIGYWLTSNWLNSFTYKIEMNLFIYILAAGITLMVALLSIIRQAVKSSNTNPVDSLRYE